MDLTTQEDLGESNSPPMFPQSSARFRIEPSNIDFSKSMAQVLGSLGDLNENLRVGFGIVAACSDNWRLTMGSCLTSHEDRLSKLEHNFSVMNTTFKNARSLSSRAQADRIDAMVTQHEGIISRQNHDVEISSLKVNTVISSMEKKIGEFEDRMSEIKSSNMNAEIPSNVVDSLNDILL